MLVTLSLNQIAARTKRSAPALFFRPTAHSLQPPACSGPPAHSPQPPARFRGFTIVETLGALLVIAVGVIGVAAIYFDNVQVNREDQFQVQAAELAETIAARVRENEAGRIGYAHTIGVVCDPAARVRTPLDEAAQEAACWEAEVQRRLPSGLGSITRDLSTTPVTYVIAVSWSAPGSGAASYVVRAE